MTVDVRFEVDDVFDLTGRGPTVMGYLTDGILTRGMTLQVESTTSRVTVRSFDPHAVRTPRGLQVMVQLAGPKPDEVLAGATLVTPGD